MNLQALPAPECSIYYPEQDNNPGIIVDPKHKTKNGFTLIELSIVLVIIGLIVGGILTGQDLISAAAQRAQIAQIEKYNTAVHTFQVKYGYLPGDIPNPYATNFGFQPRGTVIGSGDGDGFLLSNGSQSEGEMVVFWVDLSTAGLIDAGLNTASEISQSGPYTPQLYDPLAKIGNGNYVYTMAGSYWNGYNVLDGFNYFFVSAVTSANGGNGLMDSNLTMTVQQAYNIDKKTDDGLPMSGNVMPIYSNSPTNGGGLSWAGGGGGTNPIQPNLNYWSDPYSATSCYDNNGNASNPEIYETARNANSQNCALRFKFQ